MRDNDGRELDHKTLEIRSCARSTRLSKGPTRGVAAALGLHGHLYPGEIDRYAGRLDEAAVITDTAKMRQLTLKTCSARRLNGLVCADGCALGGTRTPAF